MSVLDTMIHEQMIEYQTKLKAVEKIIVEKYKSKQDYKTELFQVKLLKAQVEECVILLREMNRGMGAQAPYLLQITLFFSPSNILKTLRILTPL